jgi:hypothetical protein
MGGVGGANPNERKRLGLLAHFPYFVRSDVHALFLSKIRGSKDQGKNME